MGQFYNLKLLININFFSFSSSPGVIMTRNLRSFPKKMSAMYLLKSKEKRFCGENVELISPPLFVFYRQKRENWILVMGWH